MESPQSGRTVTDSSNPRSNSNMTVFLSNYVVFNSRTVVSDLIKGRRPLDDEDIMKVIWLPFSSVEPSFNAPPLKMLFNASNEKGSRSIRLECLFDCLFCFFVFFNGARQVSPILLQINLRALSTSLSLALSLPPVVACHADCGGISGDDVTDVDWSRRQQATAYDYSKTTPFLLFMLPI